MPMAVTVDFGGHPEYETEMNGIKKSLSSFPGYKAIASSLGKYISQEIVAGLIGCIIPESGSDHTIINANEYKGNGTKGTDGWNCGEGLIQWTYWKYKLPLINTYNADSRSTQKLPTSWDDYKRGIPISKGSRMYAVQDGRHIAGLSLDNQMLFLTLYYSGVINKLKGETNLAVIVAKIYQYKAGNGYMTNISDPIERAYETSKRYYPSSAGNHYLQSLKIAAEYIGAPVAPSSVPVSEYVMTGTQTYSQQSSRTPVTPREISSMNENTKKNMSGIILGYHMRQK